MKIVYLPVMLALLFTTTTSYGQSDPCGVISSLTGCADEIKPDSWPGVEQQSPNVHFVSLDDAISHYRRLAQQGDWPRLKGRFLLKEGKQHKQVSRIRERLRILGDYHSDSPLENPNLFDPCLTSAVEAFQRRHGLKIDGIVGPETRRALNVTPRERWHQLLVNKQRELADITVEDQDFIEINIPDYSLRYFRGDELLAEMRVIVGRKDRPTPIINSTMSAVEFNPDWNVPRSIALEDILPKLQYEREQFDRLGVKLVKGWHQEPNVVPVEQLELARFYQGDLGLQYRFWQPPGQSNPLGQMKFVFPNNFSVYMHGTPVKHLFDETQRTFSSGCIRVEYPRLLADLLFERQVQDEQFSIDEELAEEASSVSNLSGEVAFFTRYRTAWLDRDTGILNFRADVYKRDRNELAMPTLSEHREKDENSLTN